MILSFLFDLKPCPFLCPGCDEESLQPVCEGCLSFLRRNTEMVLPQETGILGLFPLFISHSVAHRILKRWKDGGGSFLEKQLFHAHPQLLKLLVSLNFDGIVPIPQDQERNWKRGHSSSLKTAEYFSGWMGVPVFRLLELQEVELQKQATLTEWERRHHLNPFKMKPVSASFDLKRILIVDDFITTGSTIHRAESVLRDFFPDSRIHAGSLGWVPRRNLDRRKDRNSELGFGLR